VRQEYKAHEQVSRFLKLMLHPLGVHPLGVQSVIRPLYVRLTNVVAQLALTAVKSETYPSYWLELLGGIRRNILQTTLRAGKGPAATEACAGDGELHGGKDYECQKEEGFNI
jgi:hypothetical protein